MHDICRLCLSVSSHLMYKLSEECEILQKIRSCLTVEICVDNALPNHVCATCINKMEEIHSFHKLIKENQDQLYHYLNTGKEYLNNFYLGLTKLIKEEEIKEISLENKENEYLNASSSMVDGDCSMDHRVLIIKSEEIDGFDETATYSSEDDMTLSCIKVAKENNSTSNKTDSITQIKDKTLTAKVKNKAKTTKTAEGSRSKKSRVKQLKKRTNITKNVESKLDLAMETNDISKACQRIDESHSIDLHIKTVNATTYTVVKLNEPKHKCLTCFELFDAQIDLLRHYNTDHCSKKVTGSDKETNPSKYTEVTIEDGIVTYKCDVCGRVYNNRKSITRHMVSHVDSRPFICKICGRTYKTASEIIRHGRAHNGFKLECSYQCGYSTVYLGALKDHERRHRTEFKYKCEKCEKGFQVRTWYEEHQNIHNGVKPFVCAICGLAFHMSRYLTAHRSTVHPQSSNLKRYECVHCCLPCDTRKTLTEHLKVHGIKTSFLCDICGKTLSNSEQLKFHKRVHLGVKPYTCGTCNKSFTKKFNLTLHARTHTGERAHVCLRCGKRYTQRSTLLRHNLRHHTGSSQKCSRCQKTFSSKSQLTTHERLCL